MRFILLTLCLLPLWLAAQPEGKNPQDVLLLHDGSVYHGRLLSEGADAYHFRLSTGDSIRVPALAIRRLSRAKADERWLSGGRRLRLRGYHGLLRGSVAFGTNEFQEMEGSFLLDNTHSYRFSPFFQIGAGTGLHLHSYQGNTYTMLPLYGELRSQWFVSGLSPFVAISGGHAFALHNNEQEWQGGNFFKPELGLRYALHDSWGISVSLAYLQQHFQRQQFDWWGWQQEQDVVLKRLLLNVAIDF